MSIARREFITGAVAFSISMQGATQATYAQPRARSNDDELFALNIDELRLSVDDAVVNADAASVDVLVRLNTPARQTVSLRFATGDDTATGDVHFVARSGFVIFQPGEQFKTVTIEMKAQLEQGEHFNLMVNWAQNNPPVVVDRGIAQVRGGEGGHPASSVMEFPLPPKPPLARLLFATDMSDFAASDTGLDAEEKPIWTSRLAHGREQPTNHELGYYVDPALHPATKPWGHGANGRFFLQAERHEGGVRDWQGNIITDSQGDPYRYSASLVTTKRLFNRIAAGCFVEAKLQLDPVFGSWPAFWLLPDDERSETLEIDVLEGFFRRSELDKPNLEMIGTTVHWNGGAAGHQMYSQSASIIEDLIPGFDPFAAHVWGLHRAETALTFYVDDLPFFQLPNVVPSKNCYLLLNLAVGGQAGEPEAELAFQPKLYVDWVRVFQTS